MNKSSELFIIAAVGVGAYLLLSKSASAGTLVPRPGALVPRPGAQVPAGYGSPTANPRAQLDALNNGAAYSVGNLLRGLFSGGGGSAPSGGGYVAPLRDTYTAGNFDYGYVPSTPTPMFGATPTWAPDNTPKYDPAALYEVNPFLFPSDTFAVNQPGGYDEMGYDPSRYVAWEG